MRPRLFLTQSIAISSILFLSCSSQTKTAETTKNELPDSTAVASAPESYSEAYEDLSPAYYGDSTFYVGYVFVFPETKEYYTQLYFRKDWINVDSLLDSTVYDGIDLRRDRLPMDQARKLLVMENMDELHIFSKDHRRTGAARLVRVEKFGQATEDQLIAVYKSDTFISDNNEVYYAITPGYDNHKIPEFSVKPVVDNALTKKLLLDLKPDTTNLDVSHYKLLPENTIFSLLSNDQVSYITEYNDDQVTVLKLVDDDTFIQHIFPVPIRVNGAPVLLISQAIRSSDVMWDYAASWGDWSYEALQRNRIGMK